MSKQMLKESASTRQVSRGRQPVTVASESVHAQPVSSCDDLQARIAKRAYELHAARGYRHGYAVEDWIEAEREILTPDGCA
jgi:Protein of unknown function (DUF2934)